MAYLLFPGRHIVNTRFQEEYLFSVLKRPIEQLPLLGDRKPAEPLTDVIFVVTSANQQHSRYNPVPFHLRAIGVDRFARRLQESLGIGFWIVGVPHFGQTGRFAEFTLKEIAEQTEGELDLTPGNTAVLTSTPAVLAMYQRLGFSILPAELSEVLPEPAFTAALPVEIVERLAEVGPGWKADAELRRQLSPATYSLWSEFPEIPKRITRLYRDPLLTDSGSLTEDRDYSTYARQMDAIIDLKYQEIAPGIVQGKIADEGCADGALLVKLARELPDSDLIGIDIAAEFIARCRERQRSGEFGRSYVYFHQRNLLEPIFEPGTIDTTICNSTLHELWSYGDREKTVQAYLAHKHAQTSPGGRLVIRDVVGFPDRDQRVFMTCRDDDGSNEDVFAAPAGRQALAAHLGGLSTRARFLRFAQDFLAEERREGKRGPETAVAYEEATVGGQAGFRLSLKDAMEFLTKKDYTDNWASEMHEEFCFWSFDEWKAALTSAGFQVLENPNAPEQGSRAYASEWRVEHWFKGKVAFYREGESGLEPLDYPVTNMILIGEKAR